MERHKRGRNVRNQVARQGACLDTCLTQMIGSHAVNHYCEDCGTKRDNALSQQRTNDAGEHITTAPNCEDWIWVWPDDTLSIRCSDDGRTAFHDQHLLPTPGKQYRARAWIIGGEHPTTQACEFTEMWGKYHLLCGQHFVPARMTTQQRQRIGIQDHRSYSQVVLLEEGSQQGFGIGRTP
jgi:hypothetical protein